MQLIFLELLKLFGISLVFCGKRSQMKFNLKAMFQFAAEQIGLKVATEGPVTILRE